MLDSSETSCPWHRTIVRSSVCSISRVRQGGAGLSGIGLSLFERSSSGGEGVRESFSYGGWVAGEILRRDTEAGGLDVSKESTAEAGLGKIEVEKRISPLRGSR